MSLKLREKCFTEFGKKIVHEKRFLNDLMIEIKLDEVSLHELQEATINYLVKSSQVDEIVKNESDLLNLLHNHELKNITANGSVISKKSISLEYNLLAKAYMRCLSKLGVNNEIEKIHFPPNLRVKYPNIKDNHMQRNHPTESMHSDGWTGASPNWVAIHIFLLGDIENNHIRYAYPPDDLKEEWLSPKLTSSENKKFVEKFKIVDYIPKKGTMLVVDNSVIHQSFRKPGAGIRVSLDTGIDVRMPDLIENSYKRDVNIEGINVDQLRKKEEFETQTILDIGVNSYFHFPDDFDDIKEKKTGFSHASRPKLVKLI